MGNFPQAFSLVSLVNTAINLSEERGAPTARTLTVPSRPEVETMQEREIFELIIKADEALKYATEEKKQARARQARTWLTQARDEARAIGSQSLVDQADQRLADLDALVAEDVAPGSPG